MLILYTHIYACMCLVTQFCLTLCKPMGYSPPGSSIHGDSPGKNTGERLPCPPPGDLSNPGIKPRSSSLQADSLPAEKHPLLLNSIPGHQVAIEWRRSKDMHIVCIPDMATSTDISMATQYLKIQPLNGVITMSGEKVCT